MGKDLTLDVLGMMNKNKDSEPKKKKTKTVKKTTSAEDSKYKSKMDELTLGQIDTERARLDKYKYSKRVTVLFSVPEILKKEFLDKAMEEGYYRERNGRKEPDQKKFFYHCLRLAGIDIPDDEKLDARRL